MARKPMVTRTIQTTVVTLLCVNTEDRSTFEQNVTLPRTYKSNEKIMKLVEEIFEGSAVKPVQVIATEVKEELLGMTEEKFIANAEVLPAREKNEN